MFPKVSTKLSVSYLLFSVTLILPESLTALAGVTRLQRRLMVAFVGLVPAPALVEGFSIGEAATSWMFVRR